MNCDFLKADYVINYVRSKIMIDKNKIKTAKKTVALFEISENNKADFESFYDVTLNQYPFAINVDNNNETKYNFTSDVAQNTQFVDDSL